jgi:hypothetical protein
MAAMIARSQEHFKNSESLANQEILVIPTKAAIQTLGYRFGGSDE